MTDRELLELAAKAAGVEYARYQESNPCGLITREDAEFGYHKYWNPLTDDGDALRLAVKLRMALEISNRQLVWVSSENCQHTIEIKFGAPYDDDDDDNSATRRAIARAAAEIGKGMK